MLPTRLHLGRGYLTTVVQLDVSRRADVGPGGGLFNLPFVAAMQNRYDVATALGITDKVLCYFLYSRNPRGNYRRFNIPKRAGGTRTISAPPSRLLWLQRAVYRELLKYYKPKICVHGFVPQKGILTNAIPHARRRLIANFDLKNFFPTIHYGRVKGVLMGRPFMFGDEAAMVIAQIACQQDGELPQGGALSPLFSNLVCRSLDNELLNLAKKHKLLYTRYADDITFSTSRPAFPSELITVDPVSAGPALEEIVTRHSFSINPKKVKFRSRERRQEVTGLTVNAFPNIPRSFIRSLAGALRSWQQHGYEAAQQHYQELFKTSGGENLRNVIRGRLEYVRMIRGENDFIYRRLVRQFNRLDSQPIPISSLTTAQPTPLHNAQRPWNEWVDKYANEVFLLTCKLESLEPDRGTAFHIGGGKVATAMHCAYDRHDEVRPYIRLDVDGAELSPTAINPHLYLGQEIDVAALELPVLATRRGIPTQLRLPQIGEEVAAIGFPSLFFRSQSLVVHVGTVEALPTDTHGTQRFIQVGFVSGGGLSGAVLIDRSGHALGIVVGNITDSAPLPPPDNEPESDETDETDAREDKKPKAKDDLRLRAPRPYGQAIPMEYLDCLIHGESLVPPPPPPEPTEPVYDGEPPAWYVEQMKQQKPD